MISIRSLWPLLFITVVVVMSIASNLSKMAWTLAAEAEGKPVWVNGTIVSLPSETHWQSGFIFSLKDSNARIQLSWRHPTKRIKVGDQWRFLVRLKKIHGTQNPGGFNYETWALENSLRAKGYIVSNTGNQLLAHAWYQYPIEHIRQNLELKIKQHLPRSPTAPWLIALMVGDRHGVRHGDWEVLRNTGTNHLMAIAGLHIGIVAGFAHVVFGWLWRRVPKLTLLMPAQIASAIGALIVACVYSALAGFSIPTQRACLMLATFIFALISRKKYLSWHVWLFVMIVVILTNPFSVLSESFWLSFGTIGLIIYGMGGRLHPTGHWWKWGRVQWVIGVGLIPLSLYFFQETSLISFVVNSIAIPWLGFLILPLCCLSSVLLFIAPTLGGAILGLADNLLSLLWNFLTWCSHLNIAVWQHAISSEWILVTSIVGILLFLLPKGTPGRWFAAIWLLPLLLAKPQVPEDGNYWLTLLDVGQGLSVIVQTHSHTLIYDTGPRLGEQLDAGESVVLPYLRVAGIKLIDTMVISHGDNDHIGGAPTIMRHMPVKLIKTSVPSEIPTIHTSTCLAGESWEWDHVRFTFLYPDIVNLGFGNDSSCVLQISNNSQKVLLTGDIEKYAEWQLLQNQYTYLAADILVAPHHGSKTSGVKEFIAAVHPHFVLYATGYRNRYHFPHQAIIDAYTKQGSVQINTAQSGAVQFKLEKNSAIMPPQLTRGQI